MATTNERPRGHVIEPARSGRSTCQSCGATIADGELRLSEAYVSDEGKWARSHRSARQPRYREYDDDDGGRYRDYAATNPDVWARFHHLACAARHQPYKLRSALAAAASDIPGRDELERAIERALSAVDLAEENPATRDEYTRFIDRLREEPDDDMLVVFGDWLQSVDDPRGELVATQHAAETATGDERTRLVGIENKLLAAHRKQLVPELAGSLVWRRGFVRRLVLTNVDGASIARALAHPSLRLLRELAVEIPSWTSLVIVANLPRPLPATLRVLELQHADKGLGAIGPLLAGGLPQLARLKLHGAAELDDLRHPTLAELELACSDANERATAVPRGEARTFVERVFDLDRERLPCVRRLVLRVGRGLDAVVAGLVATSIAKQLEVLELHGDLTASGIGFLERAGIEAIDVRGIRLGSTELAQLKRCAARVLVDEPAASPPPAAPKPIGEWLVRHTRRPEWGTGRVVEEGDDGLHVEFEHGGRKHVRNTELLEDVEAT